VTLDTLREDLATALRAGLPADINVYSYPVESGAIPAVILVPASPWWEPYRFKNSALPGALVNLDVQLVHPRTEVESAFELLETLAIAVAAVINADPKWRFRYLDKPEPIQEEGIDAMRAIMRIDTVA
jgi:hypothetical protein